MAAVCLGNAYRRLADLARLSLRGLDQHRQPERGAVGNRRRQRGQPARRRSSRAVVYARMTRAYPTAALSRPDNAGTLVAETGAAAASTRSFQTNPSLELLTHNIPAYLAGQPKVRIRRCSRGRRPGVGRRTLRSFQRVPRVAPRSDVAENLLGLGIQVSDPGRSRPGSRQFFAKATAGGLTKRRGERSPIALPRRNAMPRSCRSTCRCNTDSVGHRGRRDRGA